jgi:hypothetical protein
MKRIIVICEGPTEQSFFRTNLLAHFAERNLFVQTPLIKKSQGGVVKWEILKREIENYLKSNNDVFVTTFLDYYGINSNLGFPNWDDAHKIFDKEERMDFLENAMLNSIKKQHHYRYIPYLQLHEFEGLLFNNIDIFKNNISPDELVGLLELQEVFENFSNPELINNSKENSPSNRLKRIIKGYNKIVFGDILSEAIGINNIRSKSPRFNNWISKLESL